MIVLRGQPMADYLADNGLGSSSLKLILESPKDYLYSKQNPPKESAAQSKGTLWHTFMLERDLYFKEHAVAEDWGPLNKNPGKGLWESFKKAAKEEGKTPVKYADARDLLMLDKEMKGHNALGGILSDFEAETSFYAEIDGVRMKSREDIWCPASNSVWDVKTTSKPVDDDTLEKTIFQNGYHFSAAHHMNVMRACGVEVDTWGWIFVSTATPCPHIVIKKASVKLLEAGQKDWEVAFSMLRDCTKKDSWPGYSDGIEEIDLPPWAERYY